jgi:hypothetical protein
VKLFDWRRVLVYTHRWLGITGSLLFVAWFVSGIVMMYARMPRLSAEERLMRAPVLDLSSATLEPSAAARLLSRPAERLRAGTIAGRPVYRLFDGRMWTTVYADTGEPLGVMSREAALRIVTPFAPEHVSTLEHHRRLTEPDQWSLQIRGLLPAHIVRVGDSADTHLYVSEQLGEVVMKTTREGRVWGYLGAVVHWIYFTPIRRHSDFWVELIIWTSIAGCVLCLFGLAWGVWRYSPMSRYRLRRVVSHSPYAGMMWWHHYAGLAFGLVTLTWIFSGLLSMNPWDWSPGTSPSMQQRRALSGGPLAIDRLTLTQLRTAAEQLGNSFPLKEIELLRYRGALYAEAHVPPSAEKLADIPLGDPGAVVAARVALKHRLVSLAHPERGVFDAFDQSSLAAAARDAMPGVSIVDAVWLDRYDAYYYDRHGALTLPVLRVRYADAVGTWLYLDPRRGEIVRKEERLSRLNRWLYHGLHSLDFPWLYQQRPLWDVVVIGLSLGGIALSLTSAPQALRRLWRHVRRARASFRSSSA